MSESSVSAPDSERDLMTSDLTSVIEPIARHLQARAARDPAFRDELALWGKLLLAIAESSEDGADLTQPADGAQVTDGAAVVGIDGAPATHAPANLAHGPHEVEATHQEATTKREGGTAHEADAAREADEGETLAEAKPAAAPGPVRLVQAPVVPTPQPNRDWRTWDVTDEDLMLSESRCWIKAQASRWAATRQRRLQEGANFHDEIEPHDRDLIAQARALPDCFLWMSHRDGPMPSDLARFDDLAGCFEATAMAIGVIRNLIYTPEEAPDGFESALDLLAEAQSALRAAIVAVGWDSDRDQQRVFNWLRQTAADRQILIRRFMRLDDPADPTTWADIQARIGELDARIETVRQRKKQSRSLFNKLRYHIKLIHESPRADHSHDWRKVVEAVDEIVASGIAPSNRDLRDVVLPEVDAIPESIELTPNFELVLREIDRYLASRPAGDEEAELSAAPSDEVRQVAALLRGRAMVLIGGERRRAAEDALVRAFGLSELLWLDTKVHGSYTAFEPYVARSDVAVVVLAIRWASHGFGDVKRFCDLYGKPLVRLKAGYSPNQVAYHILAQAAGQLSREAGEEMPVAV